ncbi:hypothetical protein JN00_0025 [Metamycoplasma subdolum]|uniref:Uncharacterized protein n=1 Tax=Metamycoplasma subdolum TaxID=92407 RepID=A0A3M0A1E9_9BACT|nr:hypothetical protein [Metamycoplasma subdolum]RMA78981.1 hypothetical protein JN00_0025 [Metamycoplasma subdolum]WPB50504.1 hypothetical protein R9C05_02755 [Metamycoplasma subdolum]
MSQTRTLESEKSECIRVLVMTIVFTVLLIASMIFTNVKKEGNETHEIVWSVLLVATLILEIALLITGKKIEKLSRISKWFIFFWAVFLSYVAFFFIEKKLGSKVAPEKFLKVGFYTILGIHVVLIGWYIAFSAREIVKINKISKQEQLIREEHEMNQLPNIKKSIYNFDDELDETNNDNQYGNRRNKDKFKGWKDF